MNIIESLKRPRSHFKVDKSRLDKYIFVYVQRKPGQGKAISNAHSLEFLVYIFMKFDPCRTFSLDQFYFSIKILSKSVQFSD